MACSGGELAVHVGAYNIPILFTSGYGRSHREIPGAFLEKPFSPADLATEVRRILGQSLQ